MKIGDSQNLGGKVKLTPAGAITTLKWESSNPAVAAVNGSGVVTALSKGKAVITVTTANGKKAKVKIKVK
jgi:arabinogalactan endo-1,4-beta-galactosidase